jgi:hypothetical protein
LYDGFPLLLITFLASNEQFQITSSPDGSIIASAQLSDSGGVLELFSATSDTILGSYASQSTIQYAFLFSNELAFLALESLSSQWSIVALDISDISNATILSSTGIGYSKDRSDTFRCSNCELLHCKSQ